MKDFPTKDQLEHAKSVVVRKVVDAFTNDLKEITREINRKTERTFLPIKMTVESSPVSLYTYKEKELETNIECNNCTLHYSVYGVFAFCPDCKQHNSLQILNENLDIVNKMLEMSSDFDLELLDKVIENALEDCVSTFDGFGREICRVYASNSSDPRLAVSISFQNLEIAKHKVHNLFGYDISSDITDDEWKEAIRGFQKRHLLAHTFGVIDDDYIHKTGDTEAEIGRKVCISIKDIQGLIKIMGKIALLLSKNLQIPSQ